MHRVTAVERGERYSITLYTPGKLDRLTAQDWDNLARCGFPIYLYEPLPAKMRRLTTPSHVMNLASRPERTQDNDGSRQVAREQCRHRSDEALLSHDLANTEHLWDDLPVPSVADPTDANLVRPKTLLDCYKDAQEFMDEYVLNDGFNHGTLYVMRVGGHRTRMLGLFQALMCHRISLDLDKRPSTGVPYDKWSRTWDCFVCCVLFEACHWHGQEFSNPGWGFW